MIAGTNASTRSTTGFLKTEDTAKSVRAEGEEQFGKTGTEKHTDLCHKHEALLSSRLQLLFFFWTERYTTLASK